MIEYQRGPFHFFLNVFRRSGSVFFTAAGFAVPCALFTFVVKWFMVQGYLPAFEDSPEGRGILKDNASWSGFTFLVGFLIVFRTSQAYARFWEGCTAIHAMRAEWQGACFSTLAFSRYSKARKEEVDRFQHTFIRVMSMLHAAALADLEDSNSDQPEEISAFKYDLLDPSSLDNHRFLAVRDSECKVELVYQWVQLLVVGHLQTVLDIPAPIMSRSFQQLGNGMVHFNDALKISTIPFPFPYAQTCDCLLLIHWVLTPLVVSQWVTQPWWGAIFAFLQVFVYWCLNLIAIEVENPFGDDENDINLRLLQHEFNQNLRTLVQPVAQLPPLLADDDGAGPFDTAFYLERLDTDRQSFVEMWREIADGRMSQAIPVPCGRRMNRELSPDEFPAGDVQRRSPTSAPPCGTALRSEPPDLNSVFDTIAATRATRRHSVMSGSASILSGSASVKSGSDLVPQQSLLVLADAGITVNEPHEGVRTSGDAGEDSFDSDDFNYSREFNGDKVVSV